MKFIEYYLLDEEFVKYLVKHRKKKKVIRFNKVKEVHINFMKELMKDDKLKNLTLCQKRKRMNDEFPQLHISRSTVFKIVNPIYFN